MVGAHGRLFYSIGLKIDSFINLPVASVNHAVAADFLKHAHRDMLLFHSDLDKLLIAIRNYVPIRIKQILMSKYSKGLS